jgi:UDP-N-acetylglucosamine 2-epimerase
MHALVVFGTRPEAIKLAPVVRALRGRSVDVSLCASGQHRDLGRKAAAFLEIVPDHDLDLMQEGQSTTGVVARVLHGISTFIERQRPDVTVVQGDTSSAMAAAMASFYARVPVVHVEAGLRTHDLTRPFPEEMNRRTISVLADLHCAPTERARTNLLMEHVPGDRIHVTGNPVVDSLRWAAERARPPACAASIPADRRVILVTVHRRESFGAPLEGVIEALRRIARRGDVELVVPVHPNPNVDTALRSALSSEPSIHLTNPLDYDELAWVLKRCHLVLTDSGGLQEEAPQLGKPVLVLRDVTERPELLEAGVGMLVGLDPDRILHHVARLLDEPDVYAGFTHPTSLYGDGRAGVRIADAIVARYRGVVSTRGSAT